MLRITKITVLRDEQNTRKIQNNIKKYHPIFGIKNYLYA